MSHVLRVGVADQIAYFRAYNTDGTAKTDLTHATTGLSLSAFRVGLASIAVSSLSSKAADNTTHADGAIRPVGGNLYTLDLPDSVAASYCPSVGVRGTFTGGVIEPIPHSLVGYAPETLLTDISALLEDVAVLAKATVSSGDTSQIQIASPTGIFAVSGMLKDCLLEIKDVSSGHTSYRWVSSHTLVGGTGAASLSFDAVVSFVPAAGDLIRIFRAARFASNVTRWLDGSPSALVSGQVAAYDANANTLLNDIPTNAEFNARTLPAAAYFDPVTDPVALQSDQGVNIVKVAGVPAYATDIAVNFPLAIGTSFLSPLSLNQSLGDYGVATATAVSAVDTKVSNVQSRLPSALVSGKMSSYLAPADRTGYTLDSAYQATLVSAIDAALLNSGDATDLIGAIVARIDNTNINEASLVAAIKAALFSADSIANKLAVDGTGRVTVGTNADKTNYQLASGQSVNVASIAGAPAYAGGASVSFPVTVGTSVLTSSNVSQALTDYGAATAAAVTAVDTKASNIQSRLPSALVSGKMSSYLAPADRTGYTLDSAYQATLVSAIDAAILDGDDGTDLVGTIVSQLGNVNIDEAALVASIKSALFTPESITNKLAVDGTGRVTVGTNADKTNYSLASGQSVNVASIAGAAAYASDSAVTFPLALGTSVLTSSGVTQALGDYGVATAAAVTAVDTKVSNIQTRLPSALVSGKMSSYLAPTDRTGYTLDSAYQATLVSAIDAALLNSGDATDLIGAIVARIDNTNINEAALVAAIKASLFSAESSANKLSVDAAGRVTIGTNADKTNYLLASGQPVDVASIAGAPAYASGSSVSFPTTIGTSVLTSSGVTQTLTDYGVATAPAVTAVDSKVSNLQTRLPAALIGGKISSYIDPSDRGGYSLDPAYQATLVAAIDATLLEDGDATDLIGAIVARIDNTNINEAALVAAIKSALFAPESITNKLVVDGTGRVTVGTNADKSNYLLASGQSVNVASIAGVPAYASDSSVSFPLAIGTSVLAPAGVAQVLTDYGVATLSVVSTLDAKITNVQGRLPMALVGGKMNAHIPAEDRTGYSLDPTYQATLVAAIDAALLDSGDATDLIGAIVARIDDTNINQAALVAAIKAALFTPESITNKLVVDAAGRVVVGTNADKANYVLAAGQSVNVTSIGGAPAYAIDSSVSFPLVIGTSVLTPNSVFQSLVDYGVATGTAVTTIDTKVSNIQLRLPAALVGGKMNSYISFDDRTGYALDPSYQATLVAAIDAALLESDDTTDLIGAIAERIESQEINEAALVAALKAALFTPESIDHKLAVDENGRVVIGVNDDKSNYTLAPNQGVNVVKVGGTSVSGPGDLKADVSQVATTAQLNSRTLPAADYATSAAVSAISTAIEESGELWEVIADELAATAQTSAKLDSMIVLNGGSYQLSADALLLAPQGVTAAEVWQYSDRTLTSGEINVEIDVEALAEEIAEALTSSGLYRLTIEAVDANLDAVPGVKLQILGVAGTTRTTGSDGKATIDLDPENYTLRVIPPAGYEPVADRPIQITTSDRTERIDLVPLFPNITPQPGSCALTILVADQSGVPLAGVPLSAKLPKGYLVNIDTLNLNTQTYQTTNSQGLATLILIRNQPYDLTAQRPDGGTVTLRIQVPDQDQATFSQVFTL